MITKYNLPYQAIQVRSYISYFVFRIFMLRNTKYALQKTFLESYNTPMSDIANPPSGKQIRLTSLSKCAG